MYITRDVHNEGDMGEYKHSVFVYASVHDVREFNDEEHKKNDKLKGYKKVIVDAGTKAVAQCRGWAVPFDPKPRTKDFKLHTYRFSQFQGILKAKKGPELDQRVLIIP